LKKKEWLCAVYDQVGELSKKLTGWAMAYRSSTFVGGGYLFSDTADNDHEDDEEDDPLKRSDPLEPDPLTGPSPNTWAVSGEKEPAKKI